MAGKIQCCPLRKSWTASGNLADSAISCSVDMHQCGAPHCRDHARPALPKHFSAVKGPRGSYVADLFAGKGGVSRAVRALGFSAREWELLKGPDHDLTNPVVVFKLLEDIRKGHVLAVMLAPPCSSFSPARDRTSVIRNRQHPWGIPGISDKDLAKVRVGNSCFKTCFKVIRLLDKFGVPWVLENPHGSKCWFLPQLAAFQQCSNVQTVVTDFCMWGTKWRKRTRLLVGNVDPCDVGRLRKLCCGKKGFCSRTQKRHFQLTGSGPNGIPWTRIAQPYPTRLCHSLAHVLLSSTIALSTTW